MRHTWTQHKVVWFYVLTFAISWPSWLVMSKVAGGSASGVLTLLFSTLGTLGPLLSLWTLEGLSQGAVRVGAILANIRPMDPNRQWFLVASLAVPIITALGNLLNYLAGRESSLRFIQEGPDGLGFWVLPVMLIQFAAGLVTSPLLEEPAWRGFALGELQGRYGRELGSLLVGVLWWLWHQPMNMAFGQMPSAYGLAAMLALSFLTDSLFNLSGKNVFVAMLVHGSAYTVNVFLYQGQKNLFVLLLMCAIVVYMRIRERRVDHWSNLASCRAA